MMIQEFTALTGYEPTAEEYDIIEADYMDFDGDKKTFCRLWKKLYANKVRRQQKTKAEFSHKMQMRLEARERFNTILNTDFGHEANKSAHGAAIAGIALLDSWMNSRGGFDIRGDMIPVLLGAKVNLDEPEGLSVVDCCDLHYCEYDEEGYYLLLDYLLDKTEDDYKFARENPQYCYRIRSYEVLYTGWRGFPNRA